MGAISDPILEHIQEHRANELSAEQERFAEHVARGCSYAEAARRVGVHFKTSYRWNKIPEVRGRILELIEAEKSAPEVAKIAEREWIETRLIEIHEELRAGGTDREKRAELLGRRDTLMDLAKLKGFIVEKRQQATIKMNLASLGTAELEALLAQLPESRRRRIQAAPTPHPHPGRYSDRRRITRSWRALRSLRPPVCRVADFAVAGLP